VTNYTLDLAAGLTQVLDDGTNSYLYGLGRIGEEGPAGWAYHLPDALGSVRQVADGNGAVVLAQSYKPYGGMLSSAGTDSSAYGYTGEWTDDTGLVFLRARYYAPVPGRFISADPFPGTQDRPISHNGYAYADCNPINLVDPSGTFPSGEDEIGWDKQYIYSCHCGWIDWSHATPPRDTWERVQRDIVRSDYLALPDYKAFRVHLTHHPGGYEAPARLFGVDKIAAVSNNLNDQEKVAVFIGIRMEISELFETYQQTAWFGWAAGSSFAEEDLMSNLIGIYAAIEMGKGIDWEGFKLRLKDKCGILSDEKSRIVFRSYGASTPHSEWSPRLANTCATYAYCGTFREMPSSLTSVVQARERPRLWGKWWWHTPQDGMGLWDSPYYQDIFGLYSIPQPPGIPQAPGV